MGMFSDRTDSAIAEAALAVKGAANAWSTTARAFAEAANYAAAALRLDHLERLAKVHGEAMAGKGGQGK